MLCAVWSKLTSVALRLQGKPLQAMAGTMCRSRQGLVVWAALLQICATKHRTLCNQSMRMDLHRNSSGLGSKPPHTHSGVLGLKLGSQTTNGTNSGGTTTIMQFGTIEKCMSVSQNNNKHVVLGANPPTNVVVGSQTTTTTKNYMVVWRPGHHTQ